jgi:energy-coupling factor transport system permease protein
VGAGLALVWGGWVAAAVVLAAGLTAVRARRLRRLALVLLALLPVALSSLVINTLLPAGGGGISTALATLLRLVAFTLPPALLFSTTPPADLIADLEARGLDRRAVFVLGAALAAVPRAQARARDVIEAQRARGLDTEGSWRRRAAGVLPLVGPLVVGSLVEVEERALALEVRAFRAPGRRTVLRRPADSHAERRLRRVLLALLVVAVAARLALPVLAGWRP